VAMRPLVLPLCNTVLGHTRSLHFEDGYATFGDNVSDPSHYELHLTSHCYYKAIGLTIGASVCQECTTN